MGLLFMAAAPVCGMDFLQRNDHKAIDKYLKRHRYVSSWEIDRKQQWPQHIRREIICYRVDNGLLVLDDRGHTISDDSDFRIRHPRRNQEGQ